MEELKVLILSEIHKNSSGEIKRHYHIKWSNDYVELKEFIDKVIDIVLNSDDVSEDKEKELKSIRRKKKIDANVFSSSFYNENIAELYIELFSIGQDIPTEIVKFYNTLYKGQYIEDGDPFEADYKVAALRVEKEPKNTVFLMELLSMIKDGMDFENKLHG